MDEKDELETFVGLLTDKCVLGYYENKDLSPDFKVYQQPGVKVLGIKVFTTPWKLDFFLEFSRK